VFEVKYNLHGSLFHVILPRQVSKEEAHQLAQMALNVVGIGSVENAHGPVYGPHPPQRIDISPVVYNGSVPTKLGERPQDSINFLNYKEPLEGVRIKILALPQQRKEAIKAFRFHTDISLSASMHIIYGNFLCPLLTMETAEKIMEDFRKLEVYAKIVAADSRSIAA